jgi:hypothetical protein
VETKDNDVNVSVSVPVGARFTPLEIRIIISCHIHGAYSLTG